MKKLSQNGPAQPVGNQQAGFTVIEGLLILVVVGIIGGVGWFVLKSKNDSENTPKVQTDPEYIPNVTQNKVDPYARWKTYHNDKYGFSIKYPEGWKTIDMNQNDIIGFASADIKFPNAEEGQLNLNPLRGSWLELYAGKNVAHEDGSKDSYESDLKTNSEAVKAFSGNYKTIKIDGYNAIWSTISPEGSYIEANTYANNNYYLFRFNVPDEENKKSQDLFKKILASVDLE